MSDGNEQKDTPSGRKPLTLTRTTATGTVRQSFSHGRTKQVAVEVREKRSINRPGAAALRRARLGLACRRRSKRALPHLRQSRCSKRREAP